MKFLQMCIAKNTNAQDYLPYASTHPESNNKNVPYTLPKKITVFITDRKE